MCSQAELDEPNRGLMLLEMHIEVSRHKYNSKVAIALVLPFTANSANSRTVLAGFGIYVIKSYEKNKPIFVSISCTLLYTVFDLQFHFSTNLFLPFPKKLSQAGKNLKTSKHSTFSACVAVAKLSISSFCCGAGRA